MPISAPTGRSVGLPLAMASRGKKKMAGKALGGARFSMIEKQGCARNKSEKSVFQFRQ
jgi:hypothetical protein